MTRRRDSDDSAGPADRPGLSRRSLIQGAAALTSVAAAFPRPAIAQSGPTGEIAFATFEWTLPHTGSVLRAISQSFMDKYPNVKVREIPIPASGFHDQILTQLTAGTPPDIFRIDDPQLPLYMERGYLQPLDEALREAGVDKGRFPAAGGDAQRDGNTYAIVYQTNARQLIFNKALLAAAGIEGPPRDAAEFEQFIAKATQRDKGVFGYTFASKAGDVSGMFSSMGPIILGFGSHFTTPDGQPNATDPNVIEALSLIKRIWDGDYVPRGLDNPAANRLLFDGRVALSLNGPFVFGASTPETKANLDAVPSPLPSNKLMRSSSWYGVSAKGRNPEAAKAWIMHMLTPESQAKIVEVERVVPSLPHLIPAAIFEQSPWFRSFVDGASSAVSYLPPGLGSKAFAQVKVIGDSIENILYRNRPIPAAMADLQNTLQANLRP